jgi:perosamine synthetase
MNRKIHLDVPNIGEIEKDYLNKAVDSGYISSAGLFVPEFEESFSKYLNVRKSVSTQSGTAALHVALYELGIGKGCEVIVPALTFVATVNPIMYVGATPVFVDVDIRTWNIDPVAIEEAVTEKTKAIMPVHLYRNPCDMHEIKRIADKHGLFIIEDATESLGAKYRGRYTGTLGDLGCFSFNGNKTITTGGGGMVVGNDIQRLDHIQLLVNQAREGTEEFYHPEMGFNYRMNNLGAAMGLAQLQRLREFHEKKKKYSDIYREELQDLKSISFQKEYKDSESSNWLTCITVEDTVIRSDLLKKLKEKKVPTRRVFTPVNEFPPYRKCRFIDNGNSRRIYERGICLPSSTLNSFEDIKYVCKTLKEFYCEGSYV